MEHDRTLRFTSADHPSAPVRRIEFELTDPYVKQCWSAVVGHQYRQVPPLTARQLEHVPGWTSDAHESLLGNHLTQIDHTHRPTANVVSITARLEGLQSGTGPQLDGPTPHGSGIA